MTVCWCYAVQELKPRAHTECWDYVHIKSRRPKMKINSEVILKHSNNGWLNGKTNGNGSKLSTNISTLKWQQMQRWLWQRINRKSWIQSSPVPNSFTTALVCQPFDTNSKIRWDERSQQIRQRVQNSEQYFISLYNILIYRIFWITFRLLTQWLSQFNVI